MCYHGGGFNIKSQIRKCRPRPHELWHFWNRHFLSGFVWTGPSTNLESGFKKMWSRKAGSLVSCGRKADLCQKKYAVSKIAGFVSTWTTIIMFEDKVIFNKFYLCLVTTGCSRMFLVGHAQLHWWSDNPVENLGSAGCFFGDFSWHLSWRLSQSTTDVWRLARGL